jgi:diguanylate cyclase (GGDEF)-like protein
MFDHRSPRRRNPKAPRVAAGLRPHLGWVLAISYTTIAWWAPIACSALVLLAWRANDEHELSTHDRLTGLLNRRGWDTRWSETLRRVQRGRQRAAVLMIDLDGFKAINDTYTHDAGDDVLRETGTRLRAALRYTDVAARFGGDEFAALLLGVPDAATAKGIVARLHEELTAPVPVMVEGVRREVAIGASIGLVYLDQPTAAEAFGAADSAMFEVKRRGGGVGLGGQIEAAAVT